MSLTSPAPVSSNAQAVGLILGAVAVFTTMDALAKVLIGHYPTWQVIWARYTGQTFLVAFYLGRDLPGLLRSRYPGLQALRSVFQFGASALFFTSLGFIGLAEATAITDLNPVLITLGAAVFLGERLGPRRIFGVVAALIGALIVIRPGVGVFQPAALLPVGCAICYAAYALITRRVGRDEDARTSLFYAALLGTVVTSVTLPLVWVPIAPAHLPGFVAMGALGTAAQFLLIRAFTRGEASVIAPFGYVGLIFAAGWGIVLFDTWPDGWTVTGALVIVAAGLYVWHRETRAAQAAP